jgi:HEAT repeat protein
MESSSSINPRSQVFRFSRALLLTLACLLLSSVAVAQDRVGPYATELRDNPDFRVRTQAALALGASQDKRAIEPLCGGLEDENTTVRAAAAAALGKLMLGGEQCLERRLEEETNTSVKSVLEKALERLRGGGGPTGPSLEAASYYVGIGLVTNKTDRTDDELDRVVRSSLLKALGQLSGYAAAPKAETADQARSVLGQHKQLKPFFIWPKVNVTYSAGDLTVKFDLSLFTYPGKAFKGSLSRNLTMPDTPTRDVAAEDELIQTAAENLVPELAKVAPSLM